MLKILKEVGARVPVKNGRKKNKKKRMDRKEKKWSQHAKTKNGFKKNEKSHMRNTTTEKDSNGGDMKRNERTDVETNWDMRY